MWQCEREEEEPEEKELEGRVKGMKYDWIDDERKSQREREKNRNEFWGGVRERRRRRLNLWVHWGGERDMRKCESTKRDDMTK